MTAGLGMMASKHPSGTAGDAAVRHWLASVILMVFCMIVVGGATRLTGSGLSITEWQPIMGAIPPLSHADWLEAFAKYKQIPQYQLVNKGMSLDEFKVIFLWEWGHRFLGRAIGVAFAVPLLLLWLGGRLRQGLGWPLLGILALGGLQGFVGWYMVSSGLAERTSVSQYRLALHLTLAIVILAALVWVWLSLRPQSGPPRHDRPAPLTTAAALALAGLLLLQLVAGAFVAGLKAGLSHNTWPLIDGALIPDGLLVMSPWWINAFENTLTVQFNHRMLAYLMLALAAWHAYRLGSTGEPATGSAMALLAALVLQAALGIWTLLAQVPLALGLIHQGGGAIVTAVAVWHLHEIMGGRGMLAARRD